MKKTLIFLSILVLALIVGHRIQSLRDEARRSVNNVVRIQREKGIPREYAVAKKTTDFLEIPLFVQNGRALVGASQVGKFAAGQKIKGSRHVITSVSKNIDLDTGMFVIRVSGNITGNFLVLSRYTGYFLPADAVLPPGAKIIARDAGRIVAVGLRDGDEVVVK
jgi:hypothetical protein